MRNPTRSEMTHQTAYVTVVQCGTEGLGQRIRGVYNAGDMAEDNVTLRFPFLHGKVLDVNMTQTGGGGTARVHHEDGYSGGIIFIQSGGIRLSITETKQH